MAKRDKRNTRARKPGTPAVKKAAKAAKKPAAKPAKKQPAVKPAKKQPAAKPAKKQPAAKPAKKQPAAKPAKKAAAKPAKPQPAKAATRRPAKRTAPPASAASNASLIDQAMAAADAGDLERAADLMLSAADAAPSDWRLPNEAALYYFRLQRYGDAVACYDRALAIAPDEVMLLFNKALALIFAGEDELALAALVRVHAVDPIHAGAFFEIGKLHQKAGRFQDALEYFDTALAHETMATGFAALGGPPRNNVLVGLAMLNKARVYFELGRDDDGVAQARTLWTTFEDAARMMKLASELASAGRNIPARQVLDTLIAGVPDHAEALELRARLG